MSQQWNASLRAAPHTNSMPSPLGTSSSDGVGSMVQASQASQASSPAMGNAVQGGPVVPRRSSSLQTRSKVEDPVIISTPAGPMHWPTHRADATSPTMTGSRSRNSANVFKSFGATNASASRFVQPEVTRSNTEPARQAIKKAGFRPSLPFESPFDASLALTQTDLMDAARSLLEEAAHEILAPLAVASQLIHAACEPNLLGGKPGEIRRGEPGNAEWAQSERRRLLQIAQGRMEQASLWAENILASRRLSHPKPFGIPQRFFPDQWRRRAQPLIDRIAGSYGVSVQWTGWERSLPKLYLPSDHLTRIVNNLVVNAAMASTRGQTVSVRVAWQTSVTQSLVIAIEDQGSGLPDEMLAMLNSQESHAGSSRRRVRNGIGLHTVKQLVQAMGGSIFARRTQQGGSNSSSTGSIIRIALPVDDRPTLVRQWLDKQLFMEMSKNRQNEQEVTNALPPVSLFLVGHAAQSELESRGVAHMALHEIGEPNDMIYRVDRNRWFWLSTRAELPKELGLIPWRSAFASKWVWPAALREHLGAENSSQAQAVCLTRFARTISDSMDSLLGKHVPPLDDLNGESSSARLLRADGGHAPQRINTRELNLRRETLSGVSGAHHGHVQPERHLGSIRYGRTKEQLKH